MNYIAIGALGFLVAFFLDVVSIWKTPRAKPYIGIAAAGLIIFATFMVCLKSERLGMPIWLSWAGWAVLPAFLSLFIYSLFFNLPFHKTYVETGVGNKLIRTGTYALVRHPGVVWYALLLVSLILSTQSELLLLASPIWFAMDILHVVIQDKFFFGKMFTDYEEYRWETPMLIPNRESIIACLRTLRPSMNQSKVQEGG